ncbi:MAG: hypothetical protein ACI90V_008770, partial [Bacillariaceae sp.]
FQPNPTIFTVPEGPAGIGTPKRRKTKNDIITNKIKKS